MSKTTIEYSLKVKTIHTKGILLWKKFERRFCIIERTCTPVMWIPTFEESNSGIIDFNQKQQVSCCERVIDHFDNEAEARRVLAIWQLNNEVD